ncbi:MULTISPECIES: hypothetical protein [unclassified Curtobacterium]|uniref:hypothetical protein n=1 Tax=unclassified Curtobacterium TaxID=257496 RepID=UPI0015E89016|nr:MULTISPECIES: hypothetical protein [unclassified Curtobacterium]WIE54424.1 hypothetical protein DEI88_015100 [Curtobacterium sp. MCBD17_003]
MHDLPLPGPVLDALRSWSADMRNPPLTEVGLLRALARSGVPRFAVDALQRFAEH